MLLTFFLALPFPAFALDAVGAAIEQAQGLAVKKNRAEACATLQRAIAANSPSAKARGKLIESLNHISRVFFTDKGQKSFEAAQAMMWETPDLALRELQAALKLEDGNLQVLDNIARVQIARSECDAALKSTESARALNPFAADSALLEMRALVCLGNFDSLREKAASLPPADRWQTAFSQYMLAQDAMKSQDWRKAHDALVKIGEEFPAFPEAFFLLSRTGVELEKDTEPWLEKYVSLCKAVTPREKKRFGLEPRLCANLKEAEDELARKEKEN